MFYRYERFALLADTFDFTFLFYVRGLLIYSGNWFSVDQKFTSMDAISIPAVLFLCATLYFHEIELLVVVLGCSKNLWHFQLPIYPVKWCGCWLFRINFSKILHEKILLSNKHQI